jgi:hypothetical protein
MESMLVLHRKPHSAPHGSNIGLAELIVRTPRQTLTVSIGALPALPHPLRSAIGIPSGDFAIDPPRSTDVAFFVASYAAGFVFFMGMIF